MTTMIFRRSCMFFSWWTLFTVSCDHAERRAFPPIIPELYTENHAAGDPYNGRFPPSRALKGLPEFGKLIAQINTDLGTIECELMIEQAPLGVANFVGLARGIRPFLDEASGRWILKPYYDGLPWHRAKPGEFVQTGRRNKNQHPGFRIQDERPVGDRFDHPGVLALANTGSPNTSAAEFFITTAALPALNRLYTIVGQCRNHSLIRRLESAVLDNRSDKPRVHNITIVRQQQHS